VKLAIVAGLSIVFFLWLNLLMLALALVGVHGLLVSARYPWSRIIAAWKAIGLLLALIVVIWPLFDKTGDVLFSIGPVNIHDEAILRGVANAARIAAINFVFIIWIGTTDARELVRGFVRLGLPFRWGMALTIGLRFIPTFAGTYLTVSDAQQARGLVLQGWWFRRVRQMMPIFVAALVSALRASDQLAMTLESRGFGASRRRTVLRDIAMRRVDWTVLILTIGLTVLLLWLTLLHDVGRTLL
jgi:energy-coupling factor transport system permease protein